MKNKRTHLTKELRQGADKAGGRSSARKGNPVGWRGEGQDGMGIGGMKGTTDGGVKKNKIKDSELPI